MDLFSIMANDSLSLEASEQAQETKERQCY